MGIISGLFKVAGSAVLGVTGVTAAVLGMTAEALGNDADLLENLRDGSFHSIKKMWGFENEKEPKTEEEKLQHQIDVRHRGMRTNKVLADTALRQGEKEKYFEYMERYYTLEDEAKRLERGEGYFSNLDYELERLHSMTDDEFERKRHSLH